MMQKIIRFPFMAYQGIRGFAQSLKKDEQGLSGVVVAILLILVAVLAIVIIWGSLSGWLGELWLRIEGQGNSIE